MYLSFNCYTLDPKHVLWQGELPDRLTLKGPGFEELWKLHPTDCHSVRMRGKVLKMPRWEQAYLKCYKYAADENQALPAPELIEPFLAWAQAHIDPRLNGVLVNWYDGSLGHYVGKHRDSTLGLIKGAPIVKISLGDSRVFRLRPHLKSGLRDFRADDGTVFILPYTTNLSWTHEVPASKLATGRRISITLKAFGEVPQKRMLTPAPTKPSRSLALNF